MFRYSSSNRAAALRCLACGVVTHVTTQSRANTESTCALIALVGNKPSNKVPPTVEAHMPASRIACTRSGRSMLPAAITGLFTACTVWRASAGSRGSRPPRRNKRFGCARAARCGAAFRQCGCGFVGAWANLTPLFRPLSRNCPPCAQHSASAMASNTAS
jgi:hypothetical protein